MKNRTFVIGVDYGTDSVRALVVDAGDGSEIATSVHPYTRWAKGEYCDPAASQFRQHPADYLEGLEIAVREALALSPPGTAEAVRAISVDTTGSTPVAVDEDGLALALKPEFRDNPNAMFVLWKDHTAIREAGEINRLAKGWGGIDYTKYCGGIYSAEWFWAKILHILRTDEKVGRAAFSWVEHCDWIPAVLTGATDPLRMKRSRCAAGHKAMWHEEFGGLPSEEFLVRLDPLLGGLRGRLYTETHPADVPAGELCPAWAETLGLRPGIAVGTGAFDAHMGAVGGDIRPGALLKVMGTSTCDMMVAPAEEIGGRLVAGICGQVDGSIIPGMIGLEAGQSAFGDLYAWFKHLLMWPVENILLESEKLPGELREEIVGEISSQILKRLEDRAREIPAGQSGIVALDWINGRRTPDANQNLEAAVAGLDMGSDAPAIFKALVEATAFGAKEIVDRFVREGVEPREVIALGGVAKKSEFVMQTVADVLGLEIKVVESEQACALGAAMFAAVVCGAYADVGQAQKAMSSGFCARYSPDPAESAQYEKLHKKYKQLGAYAESLAANGHH